MPTEFAGLPSLVQKLLDQHVQHSQTIRDINATLGRISAALGMTIPGAPAIKSTGAGRKASAAKKAPVKGKRGRRSKFAVSGSESVLAFIKAKKNPTTAEVKAHWAGEGRAGGIDNMLSIMTKQKKLKRTPLGKGLRGSRYSIA